MRRVRIHTQTVELGALLKWAQVAPSGGQAKRWIQEGCVRVNGTVERRRRRRVVIGDRVEVGPHVLQVARETH